MTTPSIESLLSKYFGWSDGLPTTDGSGWNGSYDTYISPEDAQALMEYGRSSGARVASSSVGYGGDGWSWDSGQPQYADSLLGTDGQLLKLPGGQGFSLNPVADANGKMNYHLTYAKGADAWNKAQGQMAAEGDPLGDLVLAGILGVAGGALFAPEALGAMTGYTGTAAGGATSYASVADALAAGDYAAADSIAANAFNAGNTLGAGGSAAGLGGAAAGYGPGATVYEPGVGPATDGMSAFNTGNTLGAGGSAAGLPSSGLSSLLNTAGKGKSWSDMLSGLGDALMTPKGAMTGLSALAQLYGMKQQRDATNAARAPVGAPTGGAFFGASLGANPATGQGTGSKPSFQLPQARNFQDVIKRYAEGGPVQKEAGILALIKRLISGQQPGSAPAPAPAPTIGGAADALANGRRRQMEALGLKRGGLGALVDHPSGGQDDKVPAMLSGGEYVFDADAVSALGDGSTEAGAAKLDKMRENIRAHKRSAPPNKIPPKAKAPEQYMKGGK